MSILGIDAGPAAPRTVGVLAETDPLWDAFLEPLRPATRRPPHRLRFARPAARAAHIRDAARVR
jgi:hypothetical protein